MLPQDNLWILEAHETGFEAMDASCYYHVIWSRASVYRTSVPWDGSS